MEGDAFNLARFVEAQEPVFNIALGELKAGRKRNHWIWFIFPQMLGLGRSHRAEFFGIRSLQEAKSYLAHPLLGRRLIQCTEAVLQHGAVSLHEIFGSPDDMKFRSSMTLFHAASAGGSNPFKRALDHWCGGQGDKRTMELITQPDAEK